MAACRRKIVDRHTIITATITAAAGVVGEAVEVWWSDLLLSGL